MPADECATGGCAVATDADDPGALQGINYLWYRILGYTDDEAVVAAYEDFYDVELTEQQRASAYSALADDTSVIEDAASSMLQGAAGIAGTAGGSFAGAFTGAAGPFGTLAAVAAVAALGYVAFKAAT